MGLYDVIIYPCFKFGGGGGGGGVFKPISISKSGLWNTH